LESFLEIIERAERASADPYQNISRKERSATGRAVRKDFHDTEAEPFPSLDGERNGLQDDAKKLRLISA
jgi:hypothetical protein